MLDGGVDPIQNHLSNENNPGCLRYIGDEILPRYIGTNKPL